MDCFHLACSATYDPELYCMTFRFAGCIAGLQYNPEVYAAVSYRMLEPKVTISVFRTGKLTLTGVR
jgi:TATA-box binding protein (TBP) (component of TFIID and TFIIIB)